MHNINHIDIFIFHLVMMFLVKICMQFFFFSWKKKSKYTFEQCCPYSQMKSSHRPISTGVGGWGWLESKPTFYYSSLWLVAVHKVG